MPSKKRRVVKKTHRATYRELVNILARQKNRHQDELSVHKETIARLIQERNDARKKNDPRWEKRCKGYSELATRVTNQRDNALEALGKVTKERDELRTSVPAPNTVWITREGAKVNISDMEEGHLRNSIAWLTRNIVYNVGTTRWMKTLTPKIESLGAMLREAERRGIEV